MEYTTNKIAKIEEPQMVSLSGNPNFVQFESMAKTGNNNKIDFYLHCFHYNIFYFIAALSHNLYSSDR